MKNQLKSNEHQRTHKNPMTWFTTFIHNVTLLLLFNNESQDSWKAEIPRFLAVNLFFTACLNILICLNQFIVFCSVSLIFIDVDVSFFDFHCKIKETHGFLLNIQRNIMKINEEPIETHCKSKNTCNNTMKLFKTC
jgi:hypothetical protein